MSAANKGFYDAIMKRFGGGDRAVEDKALSFAHGAGGNTGVGTDIADWFLSATQDPNNTYSGSTGLLEDSREAARKYPGTNALGAASVAVPLAVGTGGAVTGALAPLVGESALAATAANALGTGVGGFLGGAYAAPEGVDPFQAGAANAGLSAGLSLAGDAAQAAFPGLAERLGVMPKPAAKPSAPRTPANRQAIPPGPTNEANARAQQTIPAPPRYNGPASEEAVKDLIDDVGPRKPEWNYPQDYVIDATRDKIDAARAARNAPMRESEFRDVLSSHGLHEPRAAINPPSTNVARFDAEQTIPPAARAPNVEQELSRAVDATKALDQVKAQGTPWADKFNAVRNRRPADTQPASAPSIPPVEDIVNNIPRAPKPLVSESMVPASDELAEAADVVHGDKLLGRQMKDADVSRFTKARDELRDGVKPAGKDTLPPKRRKKN